MSRGVSLFWSRRSGLVRGVGFIWSGLDQVDLVFICFWRDRWLSFWVEGSAVFALFMINCCFIWFWICNYACNMFLGYKFLLFFLWFGELAIFCYNVYGFGFSALIVGFRFMSGIWPFDLVHRMGFSFWSAQIRLLWGDLSCFVLFTARMGEGIGEKITWLGRKWIFF